MNAAITNAVSPRRSYSGYVYTTELKASSLSFFWILFQRLRDGQGSDPEVETGEGRLRTTVVVLGLNTISTVSLSLGILFKRFFFLSTLLYNYEICGFYNPC